MQVRPVARGDEDLVTIGHTSAQMALRDPDIRLMLRVRDDDAVAFNELVAQYQHRLLVHATNRAVRSEVRGFGVSSGFKRHDAYGSGARPRPNPCRFATRKAAQRERVLSSTFGLLIAEA